MYFNIVSVFCKLALVGVFIAVCFNASLFLGVLSTVLITTGLLVEELRYRKQRKEQDKATEELMQLIASKSGTGNC
jgi:ABC-type protease/lipase transport system fused ATPase/permease subunit